MHTSGNSDIKKKVENAINTSGYPVELFIAKIISENNEIKWNNRYFFDLEEKKARSVDIVVPSFNFLTSSLLNPILFSSELVIECKKSLKTAWVFFETDTVVASSYLGQMFDHEQIVLGSHDTESLIWKFDNSLPLHYHSNGNMQFSSIAQNYHTVRIGEDDLDDSIKQSKTKDTIFEAVNQVVKYIIYQIQSSEKRIMNKFVEKGVYPVLKMYHPIVVYDGPMYNGYLKDDKIELEERDHVILETHFATPYASNPQTFLIDIVKKNYFEKLLPILSIEHKSIRDHLDKDADKFILHAKNLQMPKKSVSYF